MDIEETGINSWVVTNPDGVEVAIIKNNHGQYICASGDEICGIEGVMVDALVALANDARL